MSKKIKVFLADDTLIAREGWKKILETAGDIDITGEAGTAALTIEKVNKLKPDVLLMDLDWFGDGTAGWMAIREIKQKHKAKIRIIAITAHEKFIADARWAGADSILEKTFSRDQLLDEIHAQAHRQKDTIDIPAYPSALELLTNRELEVLQLMANGKSNQEIADILKIATTTAKNHVKNIMGKLNAKNRTEAVSIAREMGILK